MRCGDSKILLDYIFVKYGYNLQLPAFDILFVLNIDVPQHPLPISKLDRNKDDRHLWLLIEAPGGGFLEIEIFNSTENKASPSPPHTPSPFRKYPL